MKLTVRIGAEIRDPGGRLWRVVDVALQGFHGLGWKTFIYVDPVGGGTEERRFFVVDPIEGPEKAAVALPAPESPRWVLTREDTF